MRCAYELENYLSNSDGKRRHHVCKLDHVDSFFAHVFNARIGRGQY